MGFDVLYSKLNSGTLNTAGTYHRCDCRVTAWRPGASIRQAAWTPFRRLGVSIATSFLDDRLGSTC